LAKVADPTDFLDVELGNKVWNYKFINYLARVRSKIFIKFTYLLIVLF